MGGTSNGASEASCSGRNSFTLHVECYVGSVVRHLYQASDVIWQCFRTIGIEEGILGLYGGSTSHMVRSIPSTIISLGVYESYNKILRHQVPFSINTL